MRKFPGFRNKPWAQPVSLMQGPSNDKGQEGEDVSAATGGVNVEPTFMQVPVRCTSEIPSPLGGIATHTNCTLIRLLAPSRPAPIRSYSHHLGNAQPRLYSRFTLLALHMRLSRRFPIALKMGRKCVFEPLGCGIKLLLALKKL